MLLRVGGGGACLEVSGGVGGISARGHIPSSISAPRGPHLAMALSWSCRRGLGSPHRPRVAPPPAPSCYHDVKVGGRRQVRAAAPPPEAEGSKGGAELCFALYRAVGGVWELS